ncbi:hypothetical protein KDM41_04495 [bacterium]|nr:hypothetical protein [bacterium]
MSHPANLFRTVVGTVLVLLGAATGASAGLIPVADVGQLTAALAGAAAGDTVAVACGSYAVQGLVLPAGVVLRGATGDPACVELVSDGSAPILSCADVLAPTVIEGLTFTLDDGVTAPTVVRGGGLLLASATVLVSHCDFRGLGADYGGAVYVAGGGWPSFIFCRFADNQADGVGGAMAVVGSAPQIVSCLMTGNTAGVSGAALNVAGGGRATLSYCTIDQAAAAVSALQGWDDGDITLEHVIVAGGTWLGDVSAVPAINCSDFHLGGDDPWVGLLAPFGAAGGNIAADPLFCDPTGLDGSFGLAENSPCAAAQSGCGRIGAYDVACGVSGVPGEEPGVARPRFARIEGNHPNPFNPRTEIRFSLPEAGHVLLDVYDVRGRHVRRLADGAFAAGPQSVPWDGRTDDGRACAAGVYFARLRADDRADTHRMSLIK